MDDGLRSPEEAGDGLRSGTGAAGRLIWLALLLIVSALVSLPILPGVLWALMIGYWTFPAHRAIAARLPPGTAATASTILLVSTSILPTLWLIDATHQLWTWVQASLPQTLELALTRLRAIAAGVPYVGPALLRALPRYTSQIDWVGMGATSANAIGGVVAAAIVRAGDGLFHLVIAIGTLFFVYRDGPHWWTTVARAVHSAFGAPGREATQSIERTASAVTRGVILTAVVQGLLAGLGYWVAGVPQPLLLALITIPAAVVPLGASLVWLPAAAWLALTGSPGAGLALAMWGALVVSTADNALRPLLMHDRTPLSFWPLTLSIIGGTLTLGVPGVYVGPIAWALAHAVLVRTVTDDTRHGDPQP